MAEPTQYTLSYRDLVTLLIRDAGVTEGEWALMLKFGLQGANIGPSDDSYIPSAVVGVTEIGLAKTDKPSNLSVNAKDVSPAKGRQKKS